MGIFVAPPKRNPLSEILVPTFKALSDAYFQKEAEQKEQVAVQSLSEQLQGNPSPLQFATLLAQNKDIRPETKQMLLEANKQQSQQTNLTTKATNKANAAADKAAGKTAEANEKISHAHKYGRGLGLT